MAVSRWLFTSTVLAALTACAGCTVVPSADWNSLKTENTALSKENQAQAARIENLELHCRNTRSELMQAEEELALLDEQQELSRKQLTNYQFERNQLTAQFRGLAGRQWPLSPEMTRRLQEISRDYPSLHFDPETGIAKLDTDILFDVGTADLKPAAEEKLRELAHVLKSPRAQDLKILVVGHTDDRQVAKKPARDDYRDNFHLSAVRALSVCQHLGRVGLAEERIGVAGFGAHQPVAPNIGPSDRQKNRRVELFVLAPDVPVIGWTETIPSVY